MERSTPSDPPRLKIVYILGSSRSGSTFLDTLLGNAPSTLSAGELGHIYWAFEVARTGRNSAVTWCSCGRSVAECSVWSAVWAELGARYDREELWRETDRFETVVRSVATDVLARVFWRRALHRHLEALNYTVRSVAQIAGVRAIVDSTKGSSRAWLYSLLPRATLDVRFLHVVRDGRGVVSSAVTHFAPSEIERRPSPHPPLLAAATATLHWMYMNLAASWIGWRNRDRYLRVDFEDLVRRPLDSLAALEAFLDLDLDPVRRKMASGEPLSSGHVLCGNRSKFSAPELSPTARREVPVLSRGQQAVFALLAGWLQWYYLRARRPRLASGEPPTEGSTRAPRGPPAAPNPPVASPPWIRDRVRRSDPAPPESLVREDRYADRGG